MSELTKEQKALGAFLAAMQDCGHDGAKMRAAMLGALGIESQPAASEPSSGERASIERMVNRFLGWKLPKDFFPDSFISFDRDKHDAWGGYPNSWPTGTNLLTAEQAKAMIEYMLDGYTAQPAPQADPVECKECAIQPCESCPDVKPRNLAPQAAPGAVVEGWQPIETAPKDMAARIYRVNGYAIQGFVDAAGIYNVQNERGEWRKMRGIPTHWMPLPAAPSAPKPQGE